MLRSKADPLFAEETIYDVCRFSWWSSLSATRGVEAGTLGIDSDPGSGLPHDSSPLRVLDLIEDYRKIEAFIHRRKMKREYHDLLRMKKFGSFSYHFRKIRPEAARLAESMISREDMAFIFDPNNDLPHPVRETLWEFFQFARKG